MATSLFLLLSWVTGPRQLKLKILAEAARFLVSWPKVPAMPQQPTASVVKVWPRFVNMRCHIAVPAGALVVSVQWPNNVNSPALKCDFLLVIVSN